MNYADQYREETKQFGKADLLLAAAVYLISCILIFLTGKYFYSQKLYITNAACYVLQFIQAYLLIGIIAVICRWRRQSILEIFYSKEGFSSSCEMGIAGAGVLLVFAYIMSRGRINYEFGEAAVRFLYFLVVIAIPEEFIFRGYIGKRFYGAIPNRFAAVAAAAVLFAFEHIPFHAAVRGMSLTEYFAMNWKTLIPLSVFHVIFHWMTVKYNNIAMPVIIHCIWNFIGEFFA